MTLDTENKRRSAINLPLVPALPAPSGSVTDGDRAALAYSYSGLFALNITKIEQGFAREPTQVVCLTVKGDIAGEQEFCFSPQEGTPLNLLLKQDIRPYVKTFLGRPTRILPEKAATERTRFSITIADDDKGPDFDPAVFSIISGGTFWRRLQLAQKDIVGSRVVVRRGYVVAGLTLSEFPIMFKGRLEDINTGPTGAVTLICKDDLALVDRTAPSQIGDGNLVDGSLLATDTTITVDNSDEATNPTGLDSKDLYPVVIRLDPDTAAEDVIINSISGDDLLVQQNHLNHSEDFTNIAWTKSGGAVVTANQSIGPFGGPVSADLINLPATAAAANASATGPGSVDWTFSIWMKLSGAASSDIQTLTIRVQDGAVAFGKVVSVRKDRWQRFEVTGLLTAAGNAAGAFQRFGTDTASDVFVYGAQLEQNVTTRGFYAATVTNGGADAGRGAFGSTAAAHADNIKFIETLPYRLQLTNDGMHPTVIIRDLVNRAGIDAADVDEDSFIREFEFIPSPQLRRSGNTLITKSRKISEHVKEVRESGMVDLWVSEQGTIKTRFSFRQNIPGVSTNTISDEINIIKNSATYKGNKQSRMTRVDVYFNPVSGETSPSNPDDFLNAQVTVDLAIKALSGEKVKQIFSKWIFRPGEALELAGRLLSRFKRGAEIGEWMLDLKDSAANEVGDIVTLDSNDKLQKSGTAAVRGATNWQVVQKGHQRSEGTVKIEGLFFSGLRHGIISPNDDIEDPASSFPDFDDASEAERQYGFIGDASNLVGSPAQDGYYIL